MTASINTSVFCVSCGLVLDDDPFGTHDPYYEIKKEEVILKVQEATMKEQKLIGKDLGLKNYSRLKKEELKDLIKDKWEKPNQNQTMEKTWKS